VLRRLKSILNDLSQVVPATTVYEAAQQMQQAVEARLREVAANPG
jgi:ABC-type hemin transport system substrate-binding protein